jgi:hypothetical protein
MAKAKKARQISFRMPDRAGLLSKITTAIADVKVNITAICAYGMEKTAYFMLTTNSNAKAKKALSKLGVKSKEEDVVAVEMPHRVGELQKAANRIADARINIIYMYGTASAGKASICIFKTSNDKKTISVINKK